jgi:hypothetical protein
MLPLENFNNIYSTSCLELKAFISDSRSRSFNKTNVFKSFLKDKKHRKDKVFY